MKKKLFKKRVTHTRHVKKTILTPVRKPVDIQKEMDLAEQAQIKERRQKFITMQNNIKLLFDSFMDDVLCETEEFEYNGRSYQQIKAGRRKA